VSVISPVLPFIPESKPVVTQTYRIRLPDDATPGSIVEAMVPDGRVVTITVPANVTPGVETFVDINV